MLQGKHFVTLSCRLNDVLGAIGMGVCNEYLFVIVSFDQVYKLRNPVLVQFVEDVI